MTRPSQYANSLLMIRPAAFGFNTETADSNAFQKAESELADEAIQARAMAEFDEAVTILRAQGVAVFVEADTLVPKKSDAVFPNNWLSTHEDGTVITWPMLSVSRRQEVREDIIESIGKHFQIARIWRMDREAASGAYLEGTGSMVLDRVNRIVYVCRSARTHEGLVHDFCNRMGYSPILFSATDQQQSPIYHTNVMMSVLQSQVVICLESITVPTEREIVVNAIESTGQTLITVTQAQMNDFVCNLLQVGRREQKPVVVCSTTARDALSVSQIKKLSRDSEFVFLSIPTIEHFGGGSVRCMLAEIFLSPR